MKNGQNTKIVALMSPTAATTASTAYSSYVDLANWERCTIIVGGTAGTASAGNGYTPSIVSATASPTASGSYSADTNIANSNLAQIIATGAITAQQVDYVGSARYIALLMTEEGTASITFACYAILSGYRKGSAYSATVTTGTIS